MQHNIFFYWLRYLLSCERGGDVSTGEEDHLQLVTYLMNLLIPSLFVEQRRALPVFAEDSMVYNYLLRDHIEWTLSCLLLLQYSVLITTAHW